MKGIIQVTKGNIRTYQVGKIKIAINRSKCESCATCTIIAPEIFEFDEDLICRVKDNPSKVDSKLIQEAVDNCTSKAMKITKN